MSGGSVPVAGEVDAKNFRMLVKVGRETPQRGLRLLRDAWSKSGASCGWRPQRRSGRSDLPQVRSGTLDWATREVTGHAAFAQLVDAVRAGEESVVFDGLKDWRALPLARACARALKWRRSIVALETSGFRLRGTSTEVPGRVLRKEWLGDLPATWSAFDVDVAPGMSRKTLEAIARTLAHDLCYVQRRTPRNAREFIVAFASFDDALLFRLRCGFADVKRIVQR